MSAEMEKSMEKSTAWSLGRKILAVMVALLLAVPVNTGSVLSGVAEPSELLRNSFSSPPHLGHLPGSF